MIKIFRNEKFLYCNGCARVAHDFDDKWPIDDGWDESCAMNATELQAREKIHIPEKRSARKEYFLELLETGAIEYVNEDEK